MNPLRILAVEDNPADLRLLAEYLRGDPASRFEVVGAQTMREALDLLSAGGFEAVLLDLNLPDCTGLDGLDRIGARSPLLPIIVLTGLGDAATGLLALAKNAQDFLVKGKIDGDVLTRSIRYAIERSKAQEAARQQNAELDKRAVELQAANAALQDSRLAALNLMQDAIEDRKRAEWLARIPKEDPEPVLRVAVDGSVLYINPAAMNSGWTTKDGGSLAPTLRPLVERAMANGMAVEQDVELGARTFDVVVAAFFEERYANLYGRDITARKAAERALERSKEEWERTFDTVPDLIAILDDQHRVMRVNQAMARKIGRTPPECVGAACFEVVHGCKAPPDICPHALTLKDGMEHTAEVYEAGLGGYFLVTTTPLKDAGGRMIGAVHVARDITARKQWDVQLQKFNRALNALGHSGQAMMRATDEAHFLDEACKIIVQDCGYAMVWIGFAAAVSPSIWNCPSSSLQVALTTSGAALAWCILM